MVTKSTYEVRTQHFNKESSNWQMFGAPVMPSMKVSEKELGGPLLLHETLGT